MKISLKWLNQYCNVEDYFSKPGELAERLTSAGIEVEGVEDRSRAFDKVVVGHIRELSAHPDADRLTLCQVDVGEEGLRPIVCGAKNHKAGDKVVVALPGAVLPGNFTIKVSKIRGVESQGMLASPSELGLAEDSEGILILPPEAPVGESFAQYWGLDDVIFDLSVTPNRADCLSHLGLARELACLLGRAFETPVSDFKATGAKTSDLVSLEVKNSKLCPRYAGRVIRGVKVGPSPQWLKSRLEAVEINSINNVVDVTNFVMLELGQPLHAFDIQHIQGGKIRVDNSEAGERFISLDGSEVVLMGEELVIRDDEKPVALAGVVGGQNSGVSDGTQDIFIESAHFTAETVRRTSRKFGIETDSAYRFARGTDPEMVVLAMNRACELILQLAGGEVAKDHYDHYPEPLPVASIDISVSYVAERLGYSVSEESFVDWMQRLGCQLENVQPGCYRVRPPLYRWDLTQDVDLVEEYGRLQGYEHIPEHFPPLKERPTTHSQDYVWQEKLSHWVMGEGYLQAVNYGFIGQEFARKFLGDVDLLASYGLETEKNPVALRNPLNEELNVMRVSLLPGLYKNLLHNCRYGNEYGRLFEIGYVFGRSSSSGTSSDSGVSKNGGAGSGQDMAYEQRFRLALLGWGQSQGLWQKEVGRPVVYDLKASLENILEQLSIVSYQWKKLKDAPSFAHPGQCVGLFVEGRMVGLLTSLHPMLAQGEKIRHSVALAELDVEKLLRGQPRALKIQNFSKFPSVVRDIALVVPRGVEVAEVESQIRKTTGALLQKLEVFDVFRGGDLADNEASVAFRMTYQDRDGTLSETQLHELQEKLIQNISQKLVGVRVR